MLYIYRVHYLKIFSNKCVKLKRVSIMTNKPEYIHLLSNACTNSYPENTLTNFRNSFPLPLDIDEKYEVGVQEFGFSANYTNVRVPENKSIPSLIIAKCVLGDTNTCSNTFLKKYFKYRTCIDDLEYANYTFNFRNETLRCVEKTSNNVCYDQKCTYWKYYIGNNTFTQVRLKLLQQRIMADTGVSLETDPDNRLVFKISEHFKNVEEKKTDNISHYYCWILLHPTFAESFQFNYTHIAPIPDINGLYAVSMNGEDKSLRKIYYRDELFYTHFISKRRIKIIDNAPTYSYNNLMSSVFNLNRKAYPQFIRIVSDDIRPQILNSEYSKDLVVFSPDYIESEGYVLRNIKNIDFVPLLNNTLSNFNIKLLDENNQQLQLTEGTATVIKLVLKKMPPMKESFNIRLTSAANALYPENKQNKFKVKLPTPLTLNDTWKVSLNTISHPSNFSTFLEDINSREITFIDLSGSVGPIGQTYKHQFKADYVYSDRELIGDFDYFLKRHALGNITYDDYKVTITMTAQGLFTVPKYLANILGFQPNTDDGTLTIKCAKYYKIYSENQYTLDNIIFDDPNELSAEERKKITAERSILFRPSPNNPAIFTPPSTVELELKPNYNYSIEELVDEISKFLIKNNIGDCFIVDTKVRIKIMAKGIFILGRRLASFLGYDLKTSAHLKWDTRDGTSIPLNENVNNIVVTKAEGPMQLDLLKPSYMLIYSNIVKSNIVGGAYAKLLRLAPLKHKEQVYSITEFEHKEFYELETHHIDIIEVILCAHDGEPINFSSTKDVIVNLEFSNYQQV